MMSGACEITIRAAERLHRRFLSLVKIELERRGIRDLAASHAPVLASLGAEECSVGELQTRGHYGGSNPNSVAAELASAGYIETWRHPDDRRVSMLRATAKGRAIAALIDDLYDRTMAALPQAAITPEQLGAVNCTLAGIDRMWLTHAGSLHSLLPPLTAAAVAVATTVV